MSERINLFLCPSDQPNAPMYVDQARGYNWGRGNYAAAVGSLMYWPGNGGTVDGQAEYGDTGLITLNAP